MTWLLVLTNYMIIICAEVNIITMFEQMRLASLQYSSIDRHVKWVVWE
jgi:hypothetical protein